MFDISKGKVLRAKLTDIEDRRVRREAAAMAGENYGVKYHVAVGDSERAEALAQKYTDLISSEGLVASVKRQLQLPRVERALANMVYQEIQGNGELADIDMESGLIEPYDAVNDRQTFARYAAQVILERPNQVVS